MKAMTIIVNMNCFVTIVIERDISIRLSEASQEFTDS